MMIRMEAPALKKLICSMPWTNVLVRLNGDVSFCCHLKSPIGNLNAGGSFADIWNGKVATEIRESIIAGSIHARCAHCPVIDPELRG